MIQLKNTQKSGFSLLGFQVPSKLFYVLYLFLSLVLFTISCREVDAGPIHSAKAFFATLTYPFDSIGALVASPFASSSQIAKNIFASEQTLTQLEESNRELRARNAELEETLKSTQRLEGLLKIKTKHSLTTIGTKIISHGGDSWNDSAVIDVGTQDGVDIGMPVVDEFGVLGQIFEVSATTSKVRLITDENSRISALLQNSRVHGILEGSLSKTLSLTLINIDASVEVGDSVLTSGLGGVYPKGLPLGVVSSVEKPTGEQFARIVVEPLSRTIDTEEALVITGITQTEDKQPAQSES